MRWIKFHGFFTTSKERLDQKDGLAQQLVISPSLVAHALRRGNGCDDVTH
jgi:hypothetical protein